MTITVSTALYGDGTYYQFLDRWWEGVRNLKRRPDEVLFIVDKKAAGVTKSSTPDDFSDLTRIHVHEQRESFFEFFYLANSLARSVWVAPCAIDDWFLPEALDEVDWADSEGYELILNGCQWMTSGGLWRAEWDSERIFDEKIAPGDGIKKVEMFNRIGGFDFDAKWADWTWLMKAAYHDVKVHPSNIIGWVVDEGLNHQTLSGVLNTKESLDASDAEAREWGRRLRA